jgi:hypothetical protein
LGEGTQGPLPLDAYADQPVDLASVSCSSNRSCSAVGTYNNYIGRDTSAGEGMLLTEKRGKWRAVKAVMPPDGPGEGVVLTSVSCASAGDCSAIGLYNINIDAASSDEGVLLTEKAGKWRHGVKALQPKGSGSVLLVGVSCTSPGNCGAMGDYYTGTGRHLAMLTEEAGKWRRGVKAALPRHVVEPYGAAISCASPGNCAAVATYTFDHGTRAQGLLFTEIAGSWARGVKVPLPAGSNYLSSVSCAAPGRCGAVGENRAGGARHGLLLDSLTKP